MVAVLLHKAPKNIRNHNPAMAIEYIRILGAKPLMRFPGDGKPSVSPSLSKLVTVSTNIKVGRLRKG